MLKRFMIETDILFKVMLLLVLGMGYALLWGRGNYTELRSKDLAVSNQAAKLQHQTNINQELISKIYHFRNEPNAVEEIARTELGLVKKSETFYQVIE